MYPYWIHTDSSLLESLMSAASSRVIDLASASHALRRRRIREPIPHYDRQIHLPDIISLSALLIQQPAPSWRKACQREINDLIIVRLKRKLRRERRLVRTRHPWASHFRELHAWRCLAEEFRIRKHLRNAYANTADY